MLEDLYYKRYRGDTANLLLRRLYINIEKGRLYNTRYLLDNGHFKLSGNRGRFALYLVTKIPEIQSRAQNILFKWLIKAGCDFNHVDKNGLDLLLWLLAEYKLELTKMLLTTCKFEINFTLTDRDNNNSLMYAVRTKDLDIVTILTNIYIQFGLDVDVRNIEGYTPYTEAVRLKLKEISHVLETVGKASLHVALSPFESIDLNRKNQIDSLTFSQMRINISRGLELRKQIVQNKLKKPYKIKHQKTLTDTSNSSEKLNNIEICPELDLKPKLISCKLETRNQHKSQVSLPKQDNSQVSAPKLDNSPVSAPNQDDTLLSAPSRDNSLLSTPNSDNSLLSTPNNEEIEEGTSDTNTQVCNVNTATQGLTHVGKHDTTTLGLTSVSKDVTTTLGLNHVWKIDTSTQGLTHVGKQDTDTQSLTNVGQHDTTTQRLIKTDISKTESSRQENKGNKKVWFSDNLISPTNDNKTNGRISRMDQVSNVKDYPQKQDSLEKPVALPKEHNITYNDINEMFPKGTGVRSYSASIEELNWLLAIQAEQRTETFLKKCPPRKIVPPPPVSPPDKLTRMESSLPVPPTAKLPRKESPVKLTRKESPVKLARKESALLKLSRSESSPSVKLPRRESSSVKLARTESSPSVKVSRRASSLKKTAIRKETL